MRNDDGCYVTRLYRVDWGESASWLQIVDGGQRKRGGELVEIQSGANYQVICDVRCRKKATKKKNGKNTWEAAMV